MDGTLYAFLTVMSSFFPVPQTQNRKAGFTLMEVMVSFGVFALVMTSVAWGMVMAQRLGDSARKQLVALQHARAMMEELSTLSYDDADIAVGTHTVERGGMDGRYVITEIHSGQFKQIVLTFDYPSFGEISQVELQTGISNALR